MGQTLHLEEQELQASLAYPTLRKPGLWCGGEGWVLKAGQLLHHQNRN